MAFFLAGTSPVLVVLILAGASAIFFMLPRMSAGYLGSFAGGSDMTTGFSDHVQLGRIGQIQQSNAVVMHVQIDGDNRGAYDLKWRGVALGRFDGKSGPVQPCSIHSLRLEDGRFPLWHTAPRPSEGDAADPLPCADGADWDQYFLSGHPARFLSGSYEAVATDRAGSVYDLDPETSGQPLRG